MKRIILILSIVVLSACEDENSSFVEDVTLRVNHYKQTAVGLDKTLVFLTQESEEIGTENWRHLYDEIDGLNYELGFIYDINVRKTRVTNPSSDASSIRYELINLISKTPVETANTTFELTIKSAVMFNPPDFVYGDTQSGFTLLNEIDINCSTTCNDLSLSLENEEEIKGLFSHIDSNTIKLESIIIE